MKVGVFSFFMVFFWWSLVFAQAQTSKVQWQVGYVAGQLLNSYSGAPDIGLQHSIVISGSRDQSNKSWAGLYKNVHTGISAKWSTLGNNDVLGMEWSVLPFIELDGLLGLRYNVGLGMSYFNKPYDAENNASNKAIGSSVTWAFRLEANKTLLDRPSGILLIGLAAYHASNGHVVLPNYGTNSLGLHLAYRLKHTASEVNALEGQVVQPKHSNQKFYYVRYGTGIHEFGTAWGPVGGPKKLVYTINTGLGLSIKRYLRLRADAGVRHYRQFWNYLERHPNDPLAKAGFLNASAVYVSAGGEFMTGHIGMDVSVGIYLFKPFYRRFFELFENGSDFRYLTHRYIATRLGLNYYLFPSDTQKNYNVFVGMHVNATYGKADFTELSIGLIRFIDSGQ